MEESEKLLGALLIILGGRIVIPYEVLSLAQSKVLFSELPEGILVTFEDTTKEDLEDEEDEKIRQADSIPWD